MTISAELAFAALTNVFHFHACPQYSGSVPPSTVMGTRNRKRLLCNRARPGVGRVAIVKISAAKIQFGFHLTLKSGAMAVFKYEAGLIKLALQGPAPVRAPAVALERIMPSLKSMQIPDNLG